MKPTTTSTTSNILQTLGLLNSAGDAGQYQDKAIELLGIDVAEWPENAWADIMYDSRGRCYAVYAEGELTSFDTKVQYAELGLDDCQSAFMGALERMDIFNPFEDDRTARVWRKLVEDSSKEIQSELLAVYLH